MPTCPAGSSSRKPPALASDGGRPVLRYQGCRGSHSASSSSLLGTIVVPVWIVAMRAPPHTGTRPPTMIDRAPSCLTDQHGSPPATAGEADAGQAGDEAPGR